jgi:ADP-ribosyl-[dinitrogen reductase] hydrolase
MTIPRRDSFGTHRDAAGRVGPLPSGLRVPVSGRGIHDRSSRPLPRLPARPRHWRRARYDARVKPPGTFDPISGVVVGGPFGLRPGEWTDDTSMALCLAESLLERGLRRGRPDGAVPALARRGAPEQQRPLLRHRDDRLRCPLPLRAHRRPRRRLDRTAERRRRQSDAARARPLFFAADLAEAVRRAADSSRTTHGAATAVDACRYLAGLIVGAFDGVAKDVLLSPRWSPLPGPWDEEPLAPPEVDQVAAGSFRRREPPEIKGSGYVVRSLEAALWAFDRTGSFREGAMLAVNPATTPTPRARSTASSRAPSTARRGSPRRGATWSRGGTRSSTSPTGCSGSVRPPRWARNRRAADVGCEGDAGRGRCRRTGAVIRVLAPSVSAAALRPYSDR